MEITRKKIHDPYKLVSEPFGGHDSDPHHQDPSKLHQDIHRLCRFNTESDSRINKILLVTISNMVYPINTEVLHEVFNSYGYIEQIDTSFIPNGLQASIKFQSSQDAFRAMDELQGRNIYDGCCQLYIRFVKDDTRNDEFLNRYDRMIALMEKVKTELEEMKSLLSQQSKIQKNLAVPLSKSSITQTLNLKDTNQNLIAKVSTKLTIPKRVFEVFENSKTRSSSHITANTISSNIESISAIENKEVEATIFKKSDVYLIATENTGDSKLKLNATKMDDVIGTETASACDSNLGLVSSDVQKSMIENIEAMEMDDVLGTEAANLVQNEDKKIIEKNILCEQNHEMQIVLFAANDSHNLLSQSSSAISGINEITTKANDSIFKDLDVSCLLPKTTNTTHIERDEFQQIHDDIKFVNEKAILLKTIEWFVGLNKYLIENIIFIFDPGGGSMKLKCY